MYKAMHSSFERQDMSMTSLMPTSAERTCCVCIQLVPLKVSRWRQDNLLAFNGYSRGARYREKRDRHLRCKVKARLDTCKAKTEENLVSPQGILTSRLAASKYLNSLKLALLGPKIRSIFPKKLLVKSSTL